MWEASVSGKGAEVVAVLLKQWGEPCNPVCPELETERMSRYVVNVLDVMRMSASEGYSIVEVYELSKGDTTVYRVTDPRSGNLCHLPEAVANGRVGPMGV